MYLAYFQVMILPKFASSISVKKCKIELPDPSYRVIRLFSRKVDGCKLYSIGSFIEVVTSRREELFRRKVQSTKYKAKNSKLESPLGMIS